VRFPVLLRSVEVDYNDSVQVGQVLARWIPVGWRRSCANPWRVWRRHGRGSRRRRRRRPKQAATSNAWRAVSENQRQGALATGPRCCRGNLQTCADGSIEQPGRGRRGSGYAQAQSNDLDKAVIRSPINGVVLVRGSGARADPRASFQSPILFTLAENLAQMELHV